uniref:hypothetical protein n=1 Tax=Ulva tepida TaxID=1451047 RepID=UPI0022063423|nr:hypothetical protein ON870_pgp013 [Ulva tepida]UXW92163.1 hypothetical protein [Ulva tepida]
MLLSTLCFILLVNNLTVGLTTKKLITKVVSNPFFYETKARIIKTFSFSFESQQEKKIEYNLIKSQSDIEILDYNNNFFDQEIYLDYTNLFIEAMILKIFILCFLYLYLNINQSNKMNKEYKMGSITWDYLIGLIETDGSFKISLDKKGNYKPIISISQKENTGLLNKIKIFLKKYNINSTLDISDPQKSNRAPQLRIQGSLQVLKFCELLENNVKYISFCSQKYRDFLIVKKALSNLNLDTAKKIDLVLSLHKTSLSQPDIRKYKNKNSRSNHEKRLGLTNNSSKESAKLLLEEIDKNFNDHTKEIKNSIINKISIFNNDWCAGIMDGDGCFSISIEFKTEKNKPKINFIPSFQLVMESDAKLTIEMFKFILNCEGRLIEHKDKNKKITAIYYRVTRIDELEKLLDFFKIYKTRNIVKKEQLNLISKLFEIKKQNKLEDYETIHNFIKECYKVTELGKGKGKRKYKLSEALEQVNNWST